MLDQPRDPRATPLDVRYDWHYRSWRVNGPEGDYGIAMSKSEAIKIAIDASVTGGHAVGHEFRRIHIFDRDNILLCIITRVKRPCPSSQDFQDDVE